MNKKSIILTITSMIAFMVLIYPVSLVLWCYEIFIAHMLDTVAPYFSERYSYFGDLIGLKRFDWFLFSFIYLGMFISPIVYGYYKLIKKESIRLLILIPICFFVAIYIGNTVISISYGYYNFSVFRPLYSYYHNHLDWELLDYVIFVSSYIGIPLMALGIGLKIKRNLSVSIGSSSNKKNIKVSKTGTFGTAKEADISYLKKNSLIIPKKFIEVDWIAIAKKKQYYVGIENLNKYRHTMVIAPSRQGKGVAIAIPRILDSTDSIFVLDLKSENYQSTYEESIRKGKTPVALDPYGVLDRYGKFPNVIKHLNPLNPKFIDISNDFILDEYVDSLTSALLSDAKYENSHFQEAADAMIGALLEDYIQKGSNLVELFDDFNAASYEEIIASLEEIYQETESRRALSAKGLLQKVDKKEGGGFLSTTFRSFKYLSSTVWASFFSEDGFDFGELIDKKTDLFFIIPTRMAKQHVKVVRLLLNLFMINFELANPSKLGDRRFEVFIDEAGQIKCTKEIESILEIYGERGICLTTFWQNLEQIQKTFEKPGLITEADIIHIFGVTCPNTIKWIQDKAGKLTIIKESQNKNRSSSSNSNFNSSNSRSKGSTSAEVAIPLYDTNEISEMDFTKQIIFLKGKRSFMADKIFYYDDPRYKDRAGINYVEKKGLIEVSDIDIELED